MMQALHVRPPGGNEAPIIAAGDHARKPRPATGQGKPCGKGDAFIVTVTAVPAHGHGIQRAHESFLGGRVGTKRQGFYLVENLVESKMKVRQHVVFVRAHHFAHELAGSFCVTVGNYGGSIHITYIIIKGEGFDNYTTNGGTIWESRQRS